MGGEGGGGEESMNTDDALPPPPPLLLVLPHPPHPPPPPPLLIFHPCSAPLVSERFPLLHEGEQEQEEEAKGSRVPTRHGGEGVATLLVPETSEEEEEEEEEEEKEGEEGRRTTDERGGRQGKKVKAGGREEKAGGRNEQEERSDKGITKLMMKFFCAVLPLLKSRTQWLDTGRPEASQGEKRYEGGRDWKEKRKKDDNEREMGRAWSFLYPSPSQGHPATSLRQPTKRERGKKRNKGKINGRGRGRRGT
eukprot:320353-Hanusia_phi.AAC.2